MDDIAESVQQTEGGDAHGLGTLLGALQEPGEHGVIAAGHLATISYTLERSLKWNPSAEEFSGDAEANRLRSRAKREPWRV
jgi:hypothetical protein